MRLHPRTMHVGRARGQIRSALFDLQGELDLTDAEMIGILLACAQDTAKYVLRDERHPGNPGHKADEACNDDCHHDDDGDDGEDGGGVDHEDDDADLVEA